MLKLNVFCQLLVNGKQIDMSLGSGQSSVEEIILQFIKLLRESNHTSATFSTLELSLSKRPITDAGKLNDFEKMLAENTVHVEEVKSTDIIPGYNDVTWEEYESLMDDPIFANALRYYKSRDKSGYTMDEADSIIYLYESTYKSSKFHQIIQGVTKP